MANPVNQINIRFAPPAAYEGKGPDNNPNEGKQPEATQPTDNAAYQKYWNAPIQTTVQTGTNGPVVVMQPAQGQKRVPVGRGHSQQ